MIRDSMPDRPPTKVEGQAPRAVQRDPVVIDAGRGNRWKDGDEARRRRLCSAPLVLSKVGASLHGHLAVGPWLFRRPFDGVVAVLLIVVERLPPAV